MAVSHFWLTLVFHFVIVRVQTVYSPRDRGSGETLYVTIEGITVVTDK